MEVTVFDTKPYDREYLSRAAQGTGLVLKFVEFRLSKATAAASQGSQAVCIFVNDAADSECIAHLAEHGVKTIALRSAGFNNVDLPAARSNGLSVIRVPAYSPHAVAEHTIGLLLTLNRKIHRAYNRVRELNFSLNGLVGFDLYGKTVGILGTGRIGKITAQIFRGFEAKVMAFDPFPSSEWSQTYGIEYADLNTVLSHADVLSLHLPLSPQTMHLLNAESLAKMKPGVFIVNTSRGKLIDTTALIAGLKSGHVGGVALDVYEEEEGIFFEDLSGEVLLDDELSHLLVFPNVLITSHQAFLTDEALSEIARVTCENLRRIAAGLVPLEGTSL